VSAFDFVGTQLAEGDCEIERQLQSRKVAIVGEMTTQIELVSKVLSDETTRGLFLDVVYELLKREAP